MPSAGIWGALSTWEDTDGTRWVLMPFWGPKHSKFKAPIEHGEVVQGAIAAFKVEEKPGRCSSRRPGCHANMVQAEPAIIANGVVFGYGSGEDTTQATADLGLPYNTAANRVANSTHAELYALDARTGEELWSSGDQITSFNHFTSLSVANGRVYIGTYDGKLYCFGVDREGGGDAMRTQRSPRHDRTTVGSLCGVRRGPSAACGRGLVHAQGRAAREWTTAAFDAQRTVWLRSDARLTKDSVSKGEFKFLWKHDVRQRARQLNSLTQPVLLDRLIGFRGFKALAFVGGSADRVFAIDTDLGQAVLDDAPQLLRQHRWAAAEHGACPGGLIATPSAPHSAGAVGVCRGRRRRSRRTERQRGRRAGPGRGSPGADGATQPARGAAPAGAAPAAGRAGQRRGDGDSLRRCRSGLRGRQRRLLHTLRSSNGADAEPPVPFLPPSAKPSALIFVDGVVYASTPTTAARRPTASGRST